MAIRTILNEKEDALRKKCREITQFDERLHTLLDDLKETLAKADGVGLAAPQIGILRRVAVVSYNGEYYELINPSITAKEGAVIEQEGCLSVTSLKNGKVKRPSKIVCSARDRYGKPFILEKEGWLARIICHELDHLDGVLFIDKLIREEN